MGLRAFNNLLVSLPNALVVLFGLFISVHENDVILYHYLYTLFVTFINLTNIIWVAKNKSNTIVKRSLFSILQFKQINV